MISTSNSLLTNLAYDISSTGSGKTTLLNVLALRAGYGKAYGTIKFDNQEYNGQVFKDHAFYVQQYDKNWNNLTTYEVMKYAATMFGCANDLDREVSELLKKVGLAGHEKTKCSGLSGGQQRRLSLAISLLKEPDILFLDEITSGLDSVSTLKVCELLREIADERNIAVLCTIHQPSTQVLHNFDGLILVSGGRLAYAGDREKAEEYFTNIGYPIPPRTGEAEHYLDTVDASFGDPEKVQDILNRWSATSKVPSDKARWASILKDTASVKQVKAARKSREVNIWSLVSRQSLLITRDVSPKL